MPVILTTWEVEIGRIVVQGLPRQNNLWDSSSKITRAKCTCFISTKPWVQIPVPTSPQKSSYLSEMLCIFFFFLAVLGVWIHGLVPDRNSTIWTTPLVLLLCYFWDSVSCFCLGGLDWDPPIYNSWVAGITDCTTKSSFYWLTPSPLNILSWLASNWDPYNLCLLSS
jgi:hypothetical protein